MGDCAGGSGFAFGDDLEAVGDGDEAHGAGDFFAEFYDLLGGEGDDLAGFEGRGDGRGRRRG